MLTKLILLVAVISAAFFAQHWWRAPQRTRRQRWQAAALVAMLAAIALATTGKLNPLLAALAVILPIVLQLLANLVRYSPVVVKLWRHINKNAFESANGNGMSGTLTRFEALEILGLNDRASREDIISAHRRLMQKVHPDRGGSDYLAARINLAKEALLKNDHT